MLHDLLLARRQGIVTLPQFTLFCALPAGTPVAFNRLLDGLQERLVIDWLRKKFDRSRLHRLHGSGDIAVPAQENDGNLQPNLGHPFLQVESAQARQSQVQQQTTGRLVDEARQELRR